MSYQIFTRTWWKTNPSWPEGKEPHVGTKRHVKYVNTIEEARDFCSEANRTRPASWNKLSRKYEFESA